MPVGWHSKAKWPGKAHFLLEDGTTACAHVSGPYGMLMKTLFKTEWKPLDDNDHLCKHCQRLHPRACTCGRCRVKAVPRAGLPLPPAWDDLWRALNNAPPRFGQVGVRDPDNICESFDAKGYDGSGRCCSDGHYLCVECSELSPDAPRFTQDRDGRGDRLRLFWARK